jgi:hypothetical protein
VIKLIIIGKRANKILPFLDFLKIWIIPNTIDNTLMDNSIIKFKSDDLRAKKITEKDKQKQINERSNLPRVKSAMHLIFHF